MKEQSYLSYQQKPAYQKVLQEIIQKQNEYKDNVIKLSQSDTQLENSQEKQEWRNLYPPKPHIQQCRNCTNPIEFQSDICSFCGVSVDATVEDIIGVDTIERLSSTKPLYKVFLAYDREMLLHSQTHQQQYNEKVKYVGYVKKSQGYNNRDSTPTHITRSGSNNLNHTTQTPTSARMSNGSKSNSNRNNINLQKAQVHLQNYLRVKDQAPKVGEAKGVKQSERTSPEDESSLSSSFSSLSDTSMHPERPERLHAIISKIEANGLDGQCTKIPCREATQEEIYSVHNHAYFQSIKDGTGLDSNDDMYYNKHTFRGALISAGTSAEMCSLVASGQAQSGVVFGRPPGHHAESNKALGFCYFNNAAVGARAAQKGGAKKVVIFDWDIHHGNGTEKIFYDDDSVLYISVHRYDYGKYYPGTGSPSKVGRGKGQGFNVNIGFNSGPKVGDGDYLQVTKMVVEPIILEYQPDLIIVSAGFDAAKGDPLGEYNLNPEIFGYMTSILNAIAPTVILLEGGYNLQCVADCSEQCLRALLGQRPHRFPEEVQFTTSSLSAILNVFQEQKSFWQCFNYLHLLSTQIVSGGGNGYVQRQDNLHLSKRPRQENPSLDSTTNSASTTPVYELSEDAPILNNPSQSDEFDFVQSMGHADSENHVG